MQLNIRDSFNKELPADKNTTNSRRQVFEAAFSEATPRIPSAPSIVHISDDMLQNIGLTQEDAATEEFLAIFSGAKVLPNTSPYAMCYGGHQFGHWAGQLGDGRAINLAEIVHNNQRWALQLKGAGETPYSRSADGLAVLRSSIREHLCSEAMYHLGVPTTRSLSLMLTGDEVLRDVMYDGNEAFEKGAVVCRVAPSLLRFGNFQIFAARKEHHNIEKLVNYTIKYFYPHIEQNTKEGYLAFFREVVDNTLKMVVHWQRVGFVHGVMNTDNMSILGLTIDYGPYGWLEDYDPNWTPNTTDKQHRRYRFGQQPQIALWNLYQLANALYPIINDVESLEAILQSFQKNYTQAYFEMMKKKLGLQQESEGDETLIHQLEGVLQLTPTDMTIFFRLLANVDKNTEQPLEIVKAAFYREEELVGSSLEKWTDWLKNYQQRLAGEEVTAAARKQLMNTTNPKYVLRNYMAQLAIEAADKGDYSLINELYEILKQPYAEQPHAEKWFAKRPDWAMNKIGCSMLSCSS